jgi:hypothetical protein
MFSIHDAHTISYLKTLIQNQAKQFIICMESEMKSFFPKQDIHCINFCRFERKPNESCLFKCQLRQFGVHNNGSTWPINVKFDLRTAKMQSHGIQNQCGSLWTCSPNIQVVYLQDIARQPCVSLNCRLHRKQWLCKS